MPIAADTSTRWVPIFITSQSFSHKCSFHTKPCHCTDNTKKVDDSKALRYNVMSPRDPICAARPVFAFPYEYIVVTVFT